MRAISKLPSDPPIGDPKLSYGTQKEHWLNWLRDYGSPGAYGRKVTSGRDARFVYNHVVEPNMLLYLIEAVGVVGSGLVEALRYIDAGPSMMARSAWIRRHVPWEAVEAKLWPTRRVGRLPGRLLGRRR